jgi:endonuclease/exonuclease/phosphatase family metal-dependent hydrolase
MSKPARRRFRAIVLWIILLIVAAVIWTGAHRTCMPAAEGTAFIGSPTTQPAGQSLRIGTFNIDGGQGTDGAVNLDRTARCLQRLDFVGLNEVHGSLFGEPRNQARAMSAKLHLPYLWAPVERQWWHESFGNADFTDLPVQHWQRIVLPSETFRACRNYVLTDVDFHGKTIHFLTTHVDFKPGGAEQLRIVSDVFLRLPEPAVLMGDLNSSEKNPQIQKLLKTPGVEDATASFLGEQPPSRVDWIFLRGLKTVDAGVVPVGASDHPAYWAQVQLK